VRPFGGAIVRDGPWGSSSGPPVKKEVKKEAMASSTWAP
jgi:hypothetical protein